MTIYKKSPKTKEEKLIQAREIAVSDTEKPRNIRIANNQVLKEVLDKTNELNLSGTIQTRAYGEISLQIIANLAASGRTKELIAKTLGMTPRNFRYLCEEHPEIDEAIAMGSSILGADLVEMMFGKIKRGEDKNNGLLKIALEEFAGIGKKSIKVEHTGRDGGDIEINVNNVKQSIINRIFNEEELLDAEFEEIKEDESGNRDN